MELTDKKYKESEVGLIPINWEVKTLGACLTRNPDYGINAPAVPYSDSLPTYIRITDISDDGRFNKSGKVSVNDIQSSNFYLEVGDIVLARTGASVGKSYCYDYNDGALVFAGFLIRIKPDQDFLNPKYLKFFLQSNFYLNWVKENSMRSGQPGINSNEYSRLPIPIPSKSEQTAIATALSDTDALIENLEKLIAKKRNIKQGVMQELLTGRKRLAGFNGEWMKIKLGDICDIRKGQLITEKTAAGGEFPVIAGGINPSYFHNRPNRGKNTITISASGANAGFVSFHRNPIFASDCSTIEEKGTFNIVYIFFLLQLFQKKIFKLQTGGAQPHVYPEHLKPLELVFPQEVTEQDAIANILIDIDEELSGLEKQMNKYQLIKQGMMQALLTGKIRLA